MVATNLLDLIIVSRSNKSVGIPDECVIFGDITLTPMVRRFVMMPIFVLSAKVCPDGAEATLFALLMALSNFGTTVGIYFGSFLTVLFGVTQDNYKNFIYVIIVKSFCRLLPIPLIPLLIPVGSPQDENDFVITPPPTAESTDESVSTGDIRLSVFVNPMRDKGED